MNHRLFKLLINLYPPYWATGIALEKVAPDFSEVTVRMKAHWYNRNYVNTHFGGSLYAMTDPFYMLMLIQMLGKDYVIWDKAACIEFIKPARGTVRAGFVVRREVIDDILKNTAAGQKYLPSLTADITAENGETVARVVKTLYVRKKQSEIVAGKGGAAGNFQ